MCHKHMVCMRAFSFIYPEGKSPELASLNQCAWTVTLYLLSNDFQKQFAISKVWVYKLHCV